MPIVRSRHVFDEAFTQIPNAWVRDPRLSLKAKGLLVQLMSHNPGWNVTMRSIATANGCGLDQVRSAVAELEAAGYLERRQERDQGKFGEVTWETRDPSENPVPDKPLSENPTPGNPTPKNTNTKNTNEKNTNKAGGDFRPDFEEFWSIYPRKSGKQAAYKAYLKALAVVGLTPLLDGARRYRDDPNRREAYTAMPATWLNAGRWDDEPLPAREVSPAEKAEREAAEAQRRRQAELAHTRRLLEESREAERNAAPPPKCEHGASIVSCRICLNKPIN